MKFALKPLKVLATLAFAFVAVTGFAQRTVDREAHVQALSGEARYSTKDGAWQPLSVGTKLREGDKIKTGAGSHVDVDLGGNVGIVQVAPQSLFVLGKITSTQADADRVTETQLRIDEGAMYAKINKLAKGSRYEITTPKGIAGIRGTAVYVTADGQVTVLDGQAGVAYPNANGGIDTYIVNSGETVGPNDRPPRPAPGQLLKDIVEALRDAATHGIGRDIRPFVPPLTPFISPTLPVDKKGGDSELPPIDSIRR